MNNTFKSAIWLGIASAAAMSAGLGVGRFAYTPILPEMMAELNLSASAAGAIASANLVGYLVGAIATSFHYIAGSRKVWLVLALAVNALTLVSMGYASHLGFLLSIRFINGVASAFIFVFALALMLENSDKRFHPTLSIIHFAGVGIGIVISAILVGSLIRLSYASATQWIACGIYSLIVTGFVAYIIEDKPAPRDSNHVTTRGTADVARRTIVIAYGLFGFGYIITATFLIAIVRRSAELSDIASWIWVVFGLSVIPSVAIWNRAAKAWSISLAFAFACLAESIGILASVLWPTTLGMISAATLLGVTFTGVTALGMSAIRALPTENPRREIALMTASFGVGQVAGPIVAGYAVDLTQSFLLASLLAAAALFISAVLISSPLAKINGRRI